MNKRVINKGDWVVVCDGRKALILENIGDEKFPNLHTREVYEHENAKTHEQGTDKPGRAMNSVGSARSAVEQTDWHEEAERAFLNQLVGRLDAALGAGDTQSMMIVAPPRALGVIRSSSSPALREAVREEIDKDYVRMPVHEIETQLFGKVTAS